MYKPPKRISQRDSRNNMAGLTALYKGGTPVFEDAPSRPNGPQPENDTNKLVAKWRSSQPSLTLERNKRRLATPVGYHMPIMLGWLCDGSADWIGWESVTITPNMIGRKVAVFVGLESKRASGGVVSEAQKAFMDRLRDDGGITGVVRSGEDCELARKRWRDGYAF